MKRQCILIAVTVLCLLCTTGIIQADGYKTEQIEVTHRFDDPRADNFLVVDNIWGDIQVTGTTGDDILVTIVKTISARSEDDIEEIEKEVYLDITKSETLLELYVEAPFRDRDGRSRRRNKRWQNGFEVRYDFEIRLPKGTAIEVSTVNDGEIFVGDIDGDYNVHNVNGGIEMERIGGSGDVYTINGDVTIDFVKNPSKNSRYGSLNGEVRLHFLPELSADFYLKTFNGEFYSDFPVSYLPLRADTHSEKKKSRHVYKVNRQTAVRAGHGGPEIELDGFNGDMFLLEKK